MKTALLFATILGALTLATPAAHAGGFGVYINVGGGGCGPRYYAPPVCYRPPVVYYRPAPVCYAPIVYAPVRRVYRAPIVYGGYGVNRVGYGWRR